MSVFTVLVLASAALLLVVLVTVIDRTWIEVVCSDYRIPNIPEGELSTWHRDIAYGGKDPFLVIAGCYRILKELPEVHHRVHPTYWHMSLCSDYYGQVKFLIAQKRYRFALGFLLLHFWHAMRATVIAFRTGKVWSSSELEVLSAGLFMISVKVPGMKPCFGLPAYLLLRLSIRRVNTTTLPIAIALTASKCYALTKSMRYLDEIKRLPLDRNSSPEDMLRIAQHCGVTLEELYTLLNC